MNIVSSMRTEVDYTMKFTQADLDRYLEDPWAWREDVQAQLKGAGMVAPVGGDSATPIKRAKPGPRSQITIGRGKRTAAAKNGPGRPRSANQKGRPATASGLSREKCPICGEMIASKYMNLHRKKKHSDLPAPSGNGSHPEAAPAAA